MTYEEFSAQLGRQMDDPLDEFFHNEDGVHVIVSVGEWTEDGFTAYPSIRGEVLLDAMKLAGERGAVRGKDYIITCSWKKDLVVRVVLHTTHAFLSNEDFDPNIKRDYGKV